MPAVQTTYANTHARWVEGMLLDSGPHEIVSRNLESAAGLGFGKVAVQGTLDDQIRVSEAVSKYVGLSVLDATKLGDTYAQYDTVNILKKGVIVATASVAVAMQDPVYYVPATGVLTNVAGGGANTLIPNAYWVTSTAGAGLAAVRVNN